MHSDGSPNGKGALKEGHMASRGRDLAKERCAQGHTMHQQQAGVARPVQHLPGALPGVTLTAREQSGTAGNLWRQSPPQICCSLLRDSRHRHTSQ